MFTFTVLQMTTKTQIYFKSQR